jgi:hypothetical protein
MRIRSLAVLLLCSLAVGQAAPSSPAKSAAKAASPSQTSEKAEASATKVPASAPVITVNGICDKPAPSAKTATAAKSTAACKTVITRGEFEALADALQPNMNAAMKRRLADVYPKMLVMAYEARKRGLENDPKYKQVLQFAKLQILSQELSKSLKEQSDKVADAEIEKYYKDNAAAFQQADLKRLFIPKDKQTESGEDEAEETEKPAAQASTPAPKPADQSKPAEAQKTAEQKKSDDEAKKKADEEAMKKEADTLHTRAAAGEDFDKLQKEAFEVANVKGTPPSTSIGKLTANEVPVSHRAVLDLKPGSISDVLTEPNGYYIYKVVAKDTKPLDQARDQIRATLAQQKMQDTIQSIQNEGKTELNEAYFVTPATMPGMPGMAPGGAAPAKGSAAPGAGNSSTAPTTPSPTPATKPAESAPPATAPAPHN